MAQLEDYEARNLSQLKGFGEEITDLKFSSVSRDAKFIPARFQYAGGVHPRIERLDSKYSNETSPRIFVSLFAYQRIVAGLVHPNPRPARCLEGSTDVPPFRGDIPDGGPADVSTFAARRRPFQVPVVGHHLPRTRRRMRRLLAARYRQLLALADHHHSARPTTSYTHHVSL